MILHAFVSDLTETDSLITNDNRLKAEALSSSTNNLRYLIV